MKRLIYVIYFCFALITAYTFYKAYASYDGLVEPSYYERSKQYFQTRKAEDTMGLFIETDALPTRTGTHPVGVRVLSKDGPFSKAQATITVGEMRSSETDRTYSALESTPGFYVAYIEIPRKGQWIVRFDIQHPLITTERKWFVTIN